MSAPVISPMLTTERLTLRPPEDRDFDAFAAFVDDTRSRWVGGPGSRAEAREGFDESLADWAETGLGYFYVVETATGTVLGRVGIRETGDRPEPELTYSLFAEAHEGRGYAREAAQALRGWAFDSLRLPALVSYIDPANDRSIRVAEAMGARRDDAAPRWSKHPDGLVYRHLAPEARA